MKKLLLPALLILSLSCKHKDYPELIDEHKVIITAKKHPWSYIPEDALVKEEFNRIEDLISAFTAYQDSKSDKKSSNLFYFQSIIQLSERK